MLPREVTELQVLGRCLAEAGVIPPEAAGAVSTSTMSDALFAAVRDGGPIGSRFASVTGLTESVRDRLTGDMYATATDDTLLHLGYEALTALELELPFALKIFTLIQSNEFLALLNLANTPETFAKLIRTSIVVGDFLIRNPHIHYHDWPDFNGVNAVDRAVQIVATGSTGGPQP